MLPMPCMQCRETPAFSLRGGMNLNVVTGTINLCVQKSFFCCSPVTSLTLCTVQWTQQHSLLSVFQSDSEAIWDRNWLLQ